jgi:hypothetical protein
MRVRKAFPMFPFRKFSTNANDRLVALRLVTRRSSRLRAVQHVRARNWFSRETLIFESQPCTPWCRLRG